MGFSVKDSEETSSDEFDELTTSEGIVAEINVTPLVDVFLLLLIIFMVTASQIQSQSLDVNLPKSKNGASLSQQGHPPLLLTLRADGSLLLDQRAMPRDEIKQAFRQRIESEKRKHVVFEADSRLPLSQLVEWMDVAKALGAEQLSFITQDSSQP